MLLPGFQLRAAVRVSSSSSSSSSISLLLLLLRPQSWLVTREGILPTLYISVSQTVVQTVVRRPQVVLGVCPCGPLRLNISQKKTEKIKLT
jgi:hypothetical protein